MHTNRNKSLEALKFNFPICGKQPELDINVKGWRTWDNSFKKLLNDLDSPIIVEVGSWFGKNVIELAEMFPDKNDSVYIDCDAFIGFLNDSTNFQKLVSQ